jgi:hypothetical protein
VKSKRIKKDKEGNEEKVLDCAAPDSPELLTRQSGVHRTVRCKVCSTRRSRVFPGYVGYKSPDSPREAPDSPVLRPRNGYLPRRREPTVIWSTGWSGAPHQMVRCPTEKEISQSGDSLPCIVRVLFTVRCATGQSGALTNRRQELPTKWSSNGS